MAIQPINANILKNETDALLRGINGYRGRLVLSTRGAAHSFQHAVFSFQSFISEFTRSLATSPDTDIVDTLNINNHVLLVRAGRAFASEEDRDDLEKVQKLCSLDYQHVPKMGRSRFADSEECAKEALRRYMDASLLVFRGEMAIRGHESGDEDMAEIMIPLHNLLTTPSINTAQRKLNR
jgi:hypothetical protein